MESGVASSKPSSGWPSLKDVIFSRDDLAKAKDQKAKNKRRKRKKKGTKVDIAMQSDDPVTTTELSFTEITEDSTEFLDFGGWNEDDITIDFMTGEIS